MTAVEIVRKARQKITPPDCWTKDFYAKNIEQYALTPRHPDSVCWCAMGALMAVVDDDTEVTYHWSSIERAMQNVLGVLPVDNLKNLLVAFNDSHTHAEVLDLLDKTADLLEAA